MIVFKMKIEAKRDASGIVLLWLNLIKHLDFIMIFFRVLWLLGAINFNFVKF